jgi:hypothetical protein
MTFLEAALEILKRERKPLHYKELTEKALERKLLTFVGRTPEVTMQTQLTGAVKKAPGAPFVRVKPGVFGLLRYPEPVAEPVVEKARPLGKEDDKQDAKPEAKQEAREAGKEEAKPTLDEKPGDSGAEARGRRRRRGGRGRRRDGRGGEEARSEAPKETAGAAAGDVHPEVHPYEGGHETSANEHDDADEPAVGTLSAEARAAALAETGVLEGAIEEDETGDDASGDEASGDEVTTNGGADGIGESSARLSADEARADSRSGGSGLHDSEPTPPPVTLAEPSPIPGSSASGVQGAAPSTEGSSQAGRKVLSPVDAAIEVLKGQTPGRGVHVRQIADSAVRRRLIHGEPNEAWRVMRAALASEAKERLRAGVRPRIKSAGSGLYALSRRVPDADLEKAEFVFGEACRALRERTLAALEQRLGELAPPSFEAVARVVLQREGFGPATFVKRVEGTIYVEALRGRGFRPSRCLIALRPGVSAAGRRALGELRAGVRARNQDEGLLLLAGRLADDAINEWKQPGQPVEIVDGPALAETCVRHGIGVVSASVAVDLVDADFFAELSEG